MQSEELDADLLRAVDGICDLGDGLVSGGALGVDFLATERFMTKVDNWAERMKVIIPTQLEVFAEHYFRRAQEGVITVEQAEKLVGQLKTAKESGALIEMDFDVLNEDTYFARNTEVVKNSDVLLAFQINGSRGVQDTIEKALNMNKEVILKKYEVGEVGV